MLWPKKNSCKEFDNEKNSYCSKIPPPPPPHPHITFLMVGPVNSDLAVKVNNTPLERVIKHKSLGVQIDESLNSLAPTH